MPHRSHSPGGRRGFSLVELVLVLSIIGVVAAIATPRYASSLANYRAAAAARRVVADLHLARAGAQRLSAPVTLTFDPATDRYTIGGVRNPLTGVATYTVDLSLDPYGADLASLQLTGGATAITFDGYGDPSAAGTITIVSGGMRRVVEIDAVSGRAAVR